MSGVVSGAPPPRLYVESKEDLPVQVFREEMNPVADQACASLLRPASLLDELLHVYRALIALRERDRALAGVLPKELRFVGNGSRASVEAFVEGRSGAPPRASSTRSAPAASLRRRRPTPSRRTASASTPRCSSAGSARRADSWLQHVAQLRAALEIQLRGFETR